MITLNLNEIKKLITLARNRMKSSRDLFLFQQFQGVKIFEKQEIDFQSKNVLEIGCGSGGFASVIQKKGGRVTLMDYELVYLDSSMKKLCQGRILRGDGLTLPFKSNSFDFLICASVIEHVTCPQKLVDEIHRVLNDKGVCYLSFPPFYSIRGGHGVSPYHYLGEKLGLKVCRILKKGKFRRKDISYATLWGTWGLTPLKINDVKKMIQQTPMKIMEIGTRFFNLNPAKIPILNEFLTWHVEFLIKK